MAVRVSLRKFKFRILLVEKGYRSVKGIHTSTGVVYCAQGKPEKKHKKYANTVTLPRTDFPLRLDSQKKIDRDSYIYEVF